MDFDLVYKYMEAYGKYSFFAKCLLSAGIFLSLISMSFSQKVASKPKIQLKLQAVFGGGAKQLWQGKMTVKNGSLQKVENYLMDPGERGVYDIQNDSFSWDAFTAGLEDGFIFSIKGDFNTELHFTGSPFEKVYRLGDLINKNMQVEIKSSQAVFTLSRHNKDLLTLQTVRQDMVLKPGENLHLTAFINYLNETPPSETVKTKLEVYLSQPSWLAREKVISREIDLQVNVARPVKFAYYAPKKEGVYRLKAVLTGLSDEKSQNSMEFVVIDPAYKRQVVKELKKVKVDEINCAEVLPKARFLSSADTSIEEISLGRFRFTSEKGRGVFHNKKNPKKKVFDNISWFAGRLQVLKTGETHMLEVSYPDDDWRSFAVTVIQPGPSGKISSLNLDSGIICGGQYPNSGKVKVHRIYFWPTCLRPIVLIANRFPGKRAAVGKITLWHLPGGLPELSVPALPLQRRRHLGFYYEEARIPATFSGPREKADFPTAKGKDFKGHS